MTRRQVYFINQKTGRCYLSDEFYGDKFEYGFFQADGYCDKDWVDIKECFANVENLSQFFSAVSTAESYYHPSDKKRIGTKITILDNNSLLPNNDELYEVGNYGITLDMSRSERYKKVCM